MEIASNIMNRIDSIRKKSESRKEFCQRHKLSYLFSCVKCETERQVLQEKVFRQANLLSVSGIRKRFLKANFDNFVPENKHDTENLKVSKLFAKSFNEMKGQGSNMLMLGQVGNGKTHLAVSIAKDVIERFGVKAKLITAYNLISQINETYSKTSDKTERQVKREFLSYDLLVIDEFDLNRGTTSDQLQLFDVINERYEEMLPVIVISNLSFAELEQRAGKRLVSRLLQGGLLLNFAGRDRRKFEVVGGVA